EAQAEALEARVERTVTFGRESLERTAHSDAGSGDHGPWVEPKFAQRRFRARGALVGETGETLDEGELARFDARESGGFRDRSADLLDGFCRLGCAVADAFVHDRVGRQHLGHFFEELLAALEVAGHLFKVVAIGGYSVFSGRDFSLALEQRPARGFGLVLPD